MLIAGSLMKGEHDFLFFDPESWSVGDVNQDSIYRATFNELNPDLQDELVAYLSHQGINKDLLEDIVTFARFQEAQQYVEWLGKLKGAVQ